MAGDRAYALAELVAEEIGLRGGDTPLAQLEREAATLISLRGGDLVDAMRAADDFTVRVKEQIALGWDFCRRVSAEAEGAR